MMMPQPRRAPGTGSIEPARGGGFWPRLPSRQRLGRCTTYEDAARLLDAALAELAADAHYIGGGLTFGTWGIKVIETRERQGIRSARTERSRWRQHIEEHPIADLPLTEVSRGAVRAWLDVMLSKRAAPGRGQTVLPARKLARMTVQNTLGLVRVVLGAAVERELVRENPARDVKLPRSSGYTHEPWTYLTADEQEQILTCEAIPVAQRALVAFAIGTGMRQGELWNLELRDLAGDVAIVRYGSKGMAPKNGRVRRVPVFGLAAEALRAWLPLLASQPNPLGLVWPTPSGARRQKGKAPSWWLGALRVAGILAERRHDARAVRWHDLRHTCASSLIAGWWGRKWSLDEVRQLLGHSSVTVTERYAHLADSALDAAARATAAVPRESHAGGAIVRNPLAPPAGIGPATFGLGRRSKGEQERELDPLSGTVVGLATVGLEALAAGGPHAVAEATRALAEILRVAQAAAAASGHRRAKGAA